MSFSDAWSICQAWGPVFGPAIGVLIFFLWKDWRRESRLQDRIEQLEKDQKDIILPMMSDCVEVIARNTEVMTQVGAMLTRYVRFESQEERKIFDQLMDDAEKQRQGK
jgi:hypothetical protein